MEGLTFGKVCLGLDPEQERVLLEGACLGQASF